MSEPVEPVLARLDRVVRRGNGWVARCPAHADTIASLSVAVAQDGTALLHCHAGCTTEAVVEALGLTMRDLFPQPDQRSCNGRRLAATYDYRDATGELRFQVVRYEPKRFGQRRPDGQGGWTWNLQGVERVLYRLPELLAADPADPVLVPEGEKDVERLRALGFVATTNPGGAGKWRPEYGAPLRGRQVFPLSDNDRPGREHARDVQRQLHGVAAGAWIVELPGLPPKGDVSDWLDAGGTADELHRLLLAASQPASHAPAAGPRVETADVDADPDHFVEALAAAREAALPLEVAQPDPTPPAIGTLDATLTAVEDLLCRFVLFRDPAQPVAITLWIALTYLWAQFETLIYLVLTSAVKQSGKTRTFDVLKELIPTAWRAVRPSEAVTFRRLDRDHPTLLLDEYDTVFGDRSGQFEGIRAIFNSGNRRGTTVSRAIAKGKGFELVDFDIYSPKALAGIGPLPDTVTDRAIVVHMARRAPGERLERLRTKALQALAAPIRAALAYHLERLELSDAEPAIPDELGDRAADGWEPLLAIADTAGGSWPSQARRAAVALSAAGAVDDESWGITLLADVRTVFAEQAVDRLWTGPLIEALGAIEESPWGDVRGKPLSPTFMAKLLRPFGIGPTLFRDGAEVKRGYLAAGFEDAWARYLPEPHPSTGRYSRYTRYNDDQSSQREHGSGLPPVTPVTPVTDCPGKGDGEPRSSSPPGMGGDEQMTWIS